MSLVLNFFSKKVWFLIVLVILLLGYIWYFNPDKLSLRQNKKSQVEIIHNFKADEIDKVIIKNKKGEVVLNKEQSSWFIILSADEKYPILSEYLNNGFKVLAGLTAGEIVSKNPDNYKNFNLDEENLTAVSFFSGDALKHKLFLGKNGPVYPSTFLRLENKKEVLLVKEALLVLFDRGASGWRNKKVLPIERSKVSNFTFSPRGKASFTLALSGNEWFIKKPINYKADQYLSDRLFSAVSDLIAIDFVPRSDPRMDNLNLLGLNEGKETLKFEVVLTDGTKKTLLVGNSEKDFYFAKVKDEEIVYKIDNQIEILLKQDLTRLKNKE